MYRLSIKFKQICGNDFLLKLRFLTFVSHHLKQTVRASRKSRRISNPKFVPWDKPTKPPLSQVFFFFIKGTVRVSSNGLKGQVTLLNCFSCLEKKVKNLEKAKKYHFFQFTDMREHTLYLKLGLLELLTDHWEIIANSFLQKHALDSGRLD